MAYSKYAIQRRCWMTVHEVEWVVLIGGVVLAAAATRLDVSPWWILGLAGVVTVVTGALATLVSGEPCGVSYRTGAGDKFFGITIVSSLTLYAAATLGGIFDGIRWSRAGDRDRAISRVVGIPIVSGMGVVILYFAFIVSISNCLE
jgi:hypothetical protein